MHSSHELGTPPSSVQWPFQLSVAFLAVTASRHPKLSHRLQPPLKAANLRSGSRLPFSKASNLRRASIHEPLGGPKVLSYGFETASCPPRKLQILRSASNLRRASIHEPLGGPKVLSYGFETASCPPRKLQILRSASSLPPLQNLRSASSLSPSTAPTKTSIHEPLGCRSFETAACSSAAPRACPPPACPPQQLQQKKTPSTSRWVAAKSFLTVSRPPPAPLESFKSSAAPRACPPQRLAPSSKASNLRVELCPQYHPPYSVTQSMSLVPFPAASSGLSRSQWPFWL